MRHYIGLINPNENWKLQGLKSLEKASFFENIASPKLKLQLEQNARANKIQKFTLPLPVY